MCMYTNMVNVKVAEALKDGVFHKKDKIQNLMKTHDEYLFGKISQKARPSPQQLKTVKSAKNLQFLSAQQYSLYRNSSKHVQSTKSANIRRIDCDFGFKKPRQSAIILNYLNRPHLKKLLIENKKRRERMEERKQEALVIME